MIVCICSSQLAFAQTADLSMQGVSLSPTTIPAGHTVTATGTMYNAGSATASTSHIGIYLSVDNTWNQDDSLIGFSNGSSLSAGASSYRWISLTIPAGTAPGSYYVLIAADHRQEVAETNENNNVSSMAITVVPATIDFTISSASLDPGSVVAGASLRAEAYLHNEGNTDAPSCNVGYYLSGDTILDQEDFFFGALPRGTFNAYAGRLYSANLTIPANTSPGSYHILIVADYLHEVTETNEPNNIVSRPISVVLPSIDLVVQSPSTNSSSAPAGATISAGSTLFNQGNSTASSGSVGYYLSADASFDNTDFFMGASSGGTVAPGQSSGHYPAITIPSNTVPGAYFILFVADHLNQVRESNEDNNVGSVALTVVAPTIDLTLTALSIRPGSVSAGYPITIDATVYNQGNVTASSSDLGYYLSADTTLDAADELIGTLNGWAVGSGNSADTSPSVIIPAATAAGNYYLIVAVDVRNRISESDENNNTRHAPVSIQAQGTTFHMPTSGSASVIVCSGKVYDEGGTGNYFNNTSGTLTLNPATAGNQIRLTFTSFSVQSCCDRLRIYDGTSTSAPLIGEYSLDPGTVYATNSSGALTLHFSSDFATPAAGFEADIACVETIPLPDLTVLSPMASPASPAAGNKIFVAANVSNSGMSNAPSSHLGCYLSANDTFDASDLFLGSSPIGSLTPGSRSYPGIQVTIPAGTTPGTYYILFVADHQNAFNEDSEANNVASAAIQVVEPSIDLLLTSASASAATLNSGSSFTVSSHIANQGTTPAGSSYVGYYLSANASYEETDLALGSSYGGMLTAGSSSERLATLTLPAATTAGSYYLLFIADYSRQVSETNENNNIRSVPVTVSAPNQMDLALENASLSATAIVAGRTMAASASFTNLGDVPIPRYSAAAFYLSANNTLDASDVLLGTDTLFTSIAVGSWQQVSASLSIPAGTAPGSYYLLFMADGGHAFAERDESNNLGAVAFTVEPATIDLVVHTTTKAADRLKAGVLTFSTATIANHGNTAAPSSQVSFYLSANNTFEATDVLLATVAGGNLAPMATESRTASFTIPAATASGPYFILAVADKDNAVGESNEGNNHSWVDITVEASAPDLALQSIYLPASIPAGSSDSLHTLLSNLGRADAASGLTAVFLSADSTLDMDSDIMIGGTETGPEQPLAPGVSRDLFLMVSIPANTAPGAYFLLQKADYTGLETETNEANNLIVHPIMVREPLSDLAFSFTPWGGLSPNPVRAGSSVSAAAQVVNRGGLPASVVIHYYLSADTLDWSGKAWIGAYQADRALNGGQDTLNTSQTLTIPDTTAAGNYYLVFRLDPNQAVAESNEFNNLLAFPIQVTALSRADLVLQAPALSAATVARGAVLTASATIANVGSAPTLAGKVAYYLSANNTFEGGDVFLGQSDVPALAAGASSALSASLTIPANTATGDYFVLLVADLAGLNVESDEANKVIAVPVTVSVASGIQDLEAGFSVKLTPNPAPEQVHISADQVQKGVKFAEISLFDIRGNQVLQARSLLSGHALRARLDTRQLPQGTYLLHIRLGDEVVIRRIVVAR